MTITQPVTLPNPSAVGGGVLDRARPLPAGWERGLIFATEVCLIAGTHQFCPDTIDDKAFQATDEAAFDPYGIDVSVVCTALASTEERISAARSVLSVVAEYNVGAELATGAVSGNPSLSDATPLAAAADVVEAIAAIEQAIADGLQGHLAWVHMSPQVLTTAAAAGVVYRDFDGWRTATGHVVMASPGYATALGDTIVATPEVHAGLGEITQVRVLDHTDNRVLAVHEAFALAVFDPCFNVSVGIT
jgi:hypothetical protein